MKAVPKTMCSACGKFFASTDEFDGHRVGDFGKDRRCMTLDEMLADGWEHPQRFVNIGNQQRAEMPIWAREGYLASTEATRNRFPGVAVHGERR